MFPGPVEFLTRVLLRATQLFKRLTLAQDLLCQFLGPGVFLFLGPARGAKSAGGHTGKGARRLTRFQLGCLHCRVVGVINKRASIFAAHLIFIFALGSVHIDLLGDSKPKPRGGADVELASAQNPFDEIFLRRSLSKFYISLHDFICAGNGANPSRIVKF